MELQQLALSVDVLDMLVHEQRLSSVAQSRRRLHSERAGDLISGIQALGSNSHDIVVDYELWFWWLFRTKMKIA